MGRQAEARVIRIALRQRGVVTRAQLEEAGIGGTTVDRRLRAGQLVRMYSGVYQVGPVADPLAWAQAALLAAGPDARLSHLSAARLWGWMATDAEGSASTRSPARDSAAPSAGRSARNSLGFPVLPPDEPVHVVVEGGNRGRRPGIRVHRVDSLAPDERATVHGLAVTAAARTLVDACACLRGRDAERLVAAVRRSGALDDEALRALVDRYRGRPGVIPLRAVLGQPGGGSLTRSEAEARFLDLVRLAGLPPPRTNVEIGPYEVDFLWTRQRLVVEIDGFGFHARRDRFESDRRKGAWLQAQGWRVMRLSWQQITSRAVATAVEVGQALARTG